MSLHSGQVKDRGYACSIDTRVEHGQYHALVKCGNRSRHYEGPTNGAGVSAIALAVVKDFVTRIKSSTPARNLSAAARSYAGAVAKGRRNNEAKKKPITIYTPAGASRCSTCTKSASQPYQRIVSGKIVEMCVDPIHKPYLVPISPQMSFFNAFWKKHRAVKPGPQRKANHWALPLAVGVPAGAVVGALAHRGATVKKANTGKRFVSAYSVAASKGYPYIRGEGQARAGIWYGRFTKSADGKGPALFVGYDQKGKRWVTFEGNPRARREVKDVHGRTHVTHIGESRGVGKDFYVSVIDGPRTGFLLGPYPSHGQALAAVDLGRRMAASVNDRAVWYAYGTSSAPHGTEIKTVFTLAEAKAFKSKNPRQVSVPTAREVGQKVGRGARALGRGIASAARHAYRGTREFAGGLRENADRSHHRGAGRAKGPSMLQRGDRVYCKRLDKHGTVMWSGGPFSDPIVQWDGARESQIPKKDLTYSRSPMPESHRRALGLAKGNPEGKIKGVYKGVSYEIGPRTPFPGIGWTVWVGGKKQTSGGAFYDAPDHPEGAYAWAETAVKKFIDKMGRRTNPSRKDYEATAAIIRQAAPECRTPMVRAFSQHFQADNAAFKPALFAKAAGVQGNPRQYIKCAKCKSTLIKHPDESSRDKKLCADCARGMTDAQIHQATKNPGSARCNGCNYDVPRVNPGGALARHRNPKTGVECRGNPLSYEESRRVMIGAEMARQDALADPQGSFSRGYGKGRAVAFAKVVERVGVDPWKRIAKDGLPAVRAINPGPCRRCNGKRKVDLGKNKGIPCPMCCRKNPLTPRQTATMRGQIAVARAESAKSRRSGDRTGDFFQSGKAVALQGVVNKHGRDKKKNPLDSHKPGCMCWFHKKARSA